MATTKVSQLTELTSAADDDLFLVADVSTNQSKKITKANLGIGVTNVVEDTTPQLGGDLDTNGNAITGSSVAINGSNGEFMISATENGPVALRYDNNLKLSTKSDGVNITGELEADSLDIDGDGDITGNLTLGGNLNLGDNDKAQFGAGNDLQIYSDGNNAIISEVSPSGSLNLQGSNTRIKTGTGTETLAEFLANGSVNLYYDNNKKFETTSTGVDVTGTVTADGLTVESGNDAIILSTGDSGYVKVTHPTRGGDYRITTNGTNSEHFDIQNGTAKLARFSSGGDISFYEDTGTTAKLFWDASAESLGIGTSSPAFTLHVTGDSFINKSAAGTQQVLQLNNSDTTAGTQAIKLGFSSSGVNKASINAAVYGNDYMTFNVGSDTERMRINSSGNVGIGTSSISTNFRQEMVGLTGSNTGPASSGTTQNASAVMRIRPGGGFSATLDIGQGGGTGSWLQSTDTTNLATTYPLLLNPIGGNVGIGTDSPAQQFHVHGGTGNGKGYITSNDSGTSAELFVGYWNESSTYQGLSISRTYGSADVTYNVTQSGGQHLFKVNNSEFMRINSGGYVGIGTTNPSYNLTVLDGGFGGAIESGSGSDYSALRLLTDTNDTDKYLIAYGNNHSTVPHQIALKSNNASGSIGLYVNTGEKVRVEADGDLHADGDVIAYSTTISDERLKENIQPIDDALEKVKSLKGCTFTYTADGKDSAGLIAQDVEKVLPSAVTEKELPLKQNDGIAYKTLQYDQTIGLLVEAIKELSAKVEELENK